MSAWYLATPLPVGRVRPNLNAVPERNAARSPVKNMKMRGMLRAPSQKHPNTNCPRSSGRRSKCSLPTSSASLAWDGSDYAGHVVQTTNSSLPPPLKTSESSQRSFLHRSKRKKSKQKGARAQFSEPLSAPATRCFSTESAHSRPSPRFAQTTAAVGQGATSKYYSFSEQLPGSRSPTRSKRCVGCTGNRHHRGAN